MSQQQPRRPQTDQIQPEPVKYGDMFPTVHGELAREAIKPQDAAMMQTAENLVLGRTQKGGPAAVMQSAAMKNEQAGLVSHSDVSDVLTQQGVSATETDLPGRRVITESVAGQVVGEYDMPAPVAAPAAAGTVENKITIGEALEAAALTAGDKPIDQSDAAAIQAAEVRATGLNETVPGGIAAAARTAANANVRVASEQDKTTLGDVLADAALKLTGDKAATRDDAERVTAAEIRNDPAMTSTPGGVAASVSAASRLNQERHI